VLSRRNSVLLAAGVVLLVAGVAVAVLAPHSHKPPSLPVTAPSAAPLMPKREALPAEGISAYPRIVPTNVIIPAIGVSATVIPEGLDSTGALETPPLSEQNVTGWWDGGAAPGQDGPAVIVGHVDSAAAGPLVFWNLDKMVAGESIEVEPGNLWFTVTGTQEVGKTAFPTQAVYGPTAGPTLRLITCGGAFDSATGHYVDNFIVYATQSTPSS
jgi:sortase (surface protein transpeptidase)